MSAFRSGVRKPYSRPSRGDADGMWLHDKAPIGNERPARQPSARASVPNSKLLVSNLHYEITPKDLTRIFGQIGTLVREPLIRYDRSGRSTGTAIITYETAAEATRAKNQFDGIMAKEQPMTIQYDTMPPPRTSRRSASVPTSLINRIEKPALLDRLAQDDSGVKPTRSKFNVGFSRGNVGPIRSRPLRAPRPARAPKKQPTAEELDKELDAIMGNTDIDTAVPASAAESSASNGIQDVEMA
ncbi:hypothetical protein BDQ17DRAFT_1397541 [Cyathus striatus]|nr:hypothetical protein BDQ17DRAFT_1397541 [Cyathus striatus]